MHNVSAILKTTFYFTQIPASKTSAFFAPPRSYMRETGRVLSIGDGTALFYGRKMCRPGRWWLSRPARWYLFKDFPHPVERASDLRFIACVCLVSFCYDVVFALTYMQRTDNMWEGTYMRENPQGPPRQKRFLERSSEFGAGVHYAASLSFGLPV